VSISRSLLQLGEAGKLMPMSFARRAINLSVSNVRACARSGRFRFFSSDSDPESGAIPIVAVADAEQIGGTPAGDHHIDPAAAELVWGYRRVESLPDGDSVPVLALVGAGPVELLRVALRTEGRSGEYGWEERRRIVEYCQVSGIAPEAVRDLVDPSGDFTQQVERYRTLTPELRRWVDRGMCDLRTAERLGALPAELMPAIENAGAGLSFSNRRRFLVMAQEVVRRDGPAPLAEILRSESSGRADDRLKRLQELRYPMFSALEATLRRVNHDVLGGTGVRVEAPKNFEGGALTVTFSFSSRRELERRLRSAELIREKSDELLGLLFGNN